MLQYFQFMTLVKLKQKKSKCKNLYLFLPVPTYSLWCEKKSYCHVNPALPEGVPDSVSETDEALLVFSHEVACVEIGVALCEYVPHQLLLSQLLASSVAEEWAESAHFGQQKPRLT